jgi:hypothetical protein
MRAVVLGRYTLGRPVGLPFFLSLAECGFPSPADDYVDRVLDLNDLIVKNPTATYFVRACGDSMIKAGIHDVEVYSIDEAFLALPVREADPEEERAVREARLRDPRAGAEVDRHPGAGVDRRDEDAGEGGECAGEGADACRRGAVCGDLGRAEHRGDAGAGGVLGAARGRGGVGDR